MEGDAKKIVWTVGAQLIALTVGLLTIALIVWVSGKAWKKSQSESNWINADLGGPAESGYDGNGNWLGY